MSRTPPVPAIAPEFDTVTGWDKHPSKVGGLRNRFVAEAIADIAAAGSPEIAAHIPPITVGRFLIAPDSGTSLLEPDLERYQVPDAAQAAALGLTAQDLVQIRDNLRLLNDWQVSVFKESGKYESKPQDTYRGEAGRSGFPKYVPIMQPKFGPDGSPVMATISPMEAALQWQFYHACVAEEQTNWAGQTYLAHGPIQGDHFVADSWFDLRDGRNLARYYRSWAISFGVDIDPEPST
jgi:hypothetical protein